MIATHVIPDEMSEVAKELKEGFEPFAFATIVRTVGVTAAKPGAKALLNSEGTIVQGFLGGGCTRGAVRKATLAAIETGQPQLISVVPEEQLTRQGITAGEVVDGTKFARNGCPSKGGIDIFIEPCLPVPVLTIIGSSPVAEALARSAATYHWSVATDWAATDQEQPVVVIATQGQGDLAALTQALSVPRSHVAFVGSKRKFAALSENLQAQGVPAEVTQRVKAPAGLDIGAVTPEEIALSILAELVQLRRTGIKGMPDV